MNAYKVPFSFSFLFFFGKLFVSFGTEKLYKGTYGWDLYAWSHGRPYGPLGPKLQQIWAFGTSIDDAYFCPLNSITKDKLLFFQ